ncbi:MAG: portal protein [Dichotomicrobium sp.]
MTETTVKELRERSKDAWQRKIHYEKQLREIYEYGLPFRDPSGIHALTKTQEGDQRTDKIFDGTMASAALRFAGRLQRDLAPLFQEFFAIEAGPLVPEGDQKKELTEEFQRIGKMANGVLSSGKFHMRFHEIAMDLFAGTGALNISAGDQAEPAKFRAAPITEIALEEDGDGEIDGTDWRKIYKARQLRRRWPDGDFSRRLKDLMDSNGEAELTIHQHTFYEASERRWKLKVWEEGQDQQEQFFEETYRTRPWITPRFFVVPGEPYGRGLAHLGLPSAKTTNKARELALMAAAFAVMGLWARRDDGTFNPDTATFEPLAMWQVGSTGGPLGPTLQRLEVPHNFDISSFVIEDERQQMKMAMMDDALPPMSGSVRSPTEIAERMAQLSQDLGGVYGRLTLEIVAPMVQRVIDILEQMGALQTTLTIDQLVTQVRVVAPIAAGQQAQKVQQTTSWLEMIGMIFGPQAVNMFARTEAIVPELARWLGVEERFIRSQEEITNLQEALAQMMAQQQDQPEGQNGAQAANGRDPREAARQVMNRGAS